MGVKYDDAIAYLTANPAKIEKAWNMPVMYEDSGGVLFMKCHRLPRSEDQNPLNCGCLTQIRLDRTARVIAADRCLAANLTAEIRADEKIPKRSEDIKICHLPTFARWQRRLDALLK